MKVKQNRMGRDEAMLVYYPKGDAHLDPKS